jgi:hypothetical protein
LISDKGACIGEEERFQLVDIGKKEEKKRKRDEKKRKRKRRRKGKEKNRKVYKNNY